MRRVLGGHLLRMRSQIANGGSHGPAAQGILNLNVLDERFEETAPSCTGRTVAFHQATALSTAADQATSSSQQGPSTGGSKGAKADREAMLDAALRYVVSVAHRRRFLSSLPPLSISTCLPV